MSEPLWTPSRERVENSNLFRWLADLRRDAGLPGDDFSRDYPALQRWSVENLAAFWEAAWRDAKVVSGTPHQAVLIGGEMPVLRMEPDRQWFPGARFNYARHLLRFRDDRPALIGTGERMARRTVTYAELYRMVCLCAAGLEALGVGPGDRVAGYLPNIVEAVVAMLAATSLGAVWSSTSPDFGFQGVLDRFGQIDPVVLFCADGYRYNGKDHPTLENAARLAQEIPSIRKVVAVPFLNDDPAEAPALPESMLAWDKLLELGAISGESREPPFPELPFDHPLYILYSSGTTGVPKCIVHGTGGALLKLHMEQKFHGDMGREDVVFFFTTCGWMMWNWLVAGLAQGATLVLYDGSPAYPGPEALFQMAEELGVTIFGTSPKFLATCRKAELSPGQTFDLSRLRTVMSTGAPLEPELFQWVYDAMKADVQLASISGGTDICGCFMLGNPFQPVHAGEIQGAALGVDLAAFDEHGEPVVGQKGELVCRKPFPSMPIGFWHDGDGAKYRGAYFDQWPGIWRHGDFIEVGQNGGVIVFGRSDATLNPGGVRIGTAELYRIVEDLPEVADSLVVGQQWQGDVRVLLFVVPAPGVALDAALEQTIRAAIRRHATPRHMPARILPIREVPVTLNGKKVELAVTQILRGDEVKNRDALANPDSLEQFEGLEI